MRRQARAAVVTGSSSGIGRATALLLDRKGWVVFAGVRNEEDGASLRRQASALLQPVVLDVRDRDHITSLRELIADRFQEERLQALINNAGVAVGGPLEHLDEEQLRAPIEVNLLGPLRMAQALLPALRRGRGRIVNVTSGAASLVMPGTGLYASSKLALDAASAQLRAELAEFGVPVILVDPGLVKTRLTDLAVEAHRASVEALSEDARKLYADLLPQMASQAERVNQRGKSPHVVASVIAQAVTDTKPRERYAVGTDARAVRLLSALPSGARRWILPKKG